MKKVFLCALLIACVNFSFSQTETISQINVGGSNLTINSTVTPYGGPKIYFARNGGNLAYSMGYAVFPAQGSGQFRLTSSSGKGLSFNSDFFKINLPLLIGTSFNTNIPNDYKLAVDGKAIAEEMWVQNSFNWPDYVFASDYNLRSLNEVQSFITENSHLPEVPSAKEIEEKGINTGEMHAILLKKIEELTLYIIENKNETDILKEEIIKLKEENKKLEKIISTK